MKPTPQISSQRSASFPLTDYHYQSTIEGSHAGVKETRCGHPSRGFWRLSTKFFGAEAIRDDATDFLVFTVIALMSAWPIVANVVAVVQLLRAA